MTNPRLFPQLFRLIAILCGLNFGRTLRAADSTMHVHVSSSVPTKAPSGHSRESGSSMWLMAGLALDAMAPNVGAPDNVLGYSYKIGFTNDDRIFQFAFHGINASSPTGTPSEEHRYDYALLYGFCLRNRVLFMTAGAGIGVVDFSRRGAPIDAFGRDTTYATEWSKCFCSRIFADRT